MHKHAREIKAWADGAQIEVRFYGATQWVPIKDPSWSLDCEYKIADGGSDEAYRELLRNYIDVKLKYEALLAGVKSLGDHYA